MAASLSLPSQVSARPLAPNVEWLIFFRLLQGLGSSTGMVVPRAIVRDLHTGPEATKLMSLLMLVFSISPILAPLTGSFIIEAFGWRAVFWAVLIAAVLAFVLMMVALEETRPAELRGGSSFAASWEGYKVLSADRNFLGLVLIGGFGIASFFVYLANSSFIIIDHYGMSPSVYSLFFSVNAVSFFGVSQMSGWMTEKYGLRRVIRIAVFGFASAIIAMWIVMASGFHSLAFMTVALFVGYGFLGLVIPTTSVLAMEDHGEIAGTASALMGTLHMVTGVAAMTVSGFFANGLPMPMVTGIAACAAIALLLTLATLKSRGRMEASGDAGRSKRRETRYPVKGPGFAQSLFLDQSRAMSWSGPAEIGHAHVITNSARCADRLRDGQLPPARTPSCRHRSRP